jgi:hypothetical protein
VPFEPIDGFLRRLAGVHWRGGIDVISGHYFERHPTADKGFPFALNKEFMREAAFFVDVPG